MRRLLKVAGVLAAIVVAVGVAARFLLRPSNERKWAVDQAVLPVAEIAPPLVTIRNIRNFTYETTDRYTPAYYDKTFDLRKLDSAWFIVEPFGKGGVAHTFVSFGFEDRDFLAISIEIRKEQGESFSALKGLLRQYEIMYVIGDERDLIKLRSNFRKDPIHLYRIHSTKERIQATFLSMLRRANHLRAHPEFYNTATNTCTTNLVRHVNEITPERIPFRLGVVLPAHSDRLAYDLGLIDRSLPFAETRRRALINAAAEKYADDPEFSRRIRGLWSAEATPPL
ncbi:MAG TPA: DUF4105 domain-containing protein [Thermoanaerobaculia bacterium]|nr:DUF4105 domain-containing protein [Thermoanaerobaculia bacterium]